MLFANDPDTGLPYFVHHVDNTAAPGGDGSFGSPHDALFDAKFASRPDDIIFVREGDGTTNGMNAGITLQDGQLFLGDGVEHNIPLLGGGTFLLCNDVDLNKPTITNGAGLDVVTLAERNTVAGFNIDGEDVARHGIFGDGATFADGAITNTTIRDNMIFDVVEDGVHLEDIDGATVLAADMITVISDESTNIVDNMIFDVGDDAIEIDGVVGTGNTILIGTNTITMPGDEGFVLGAAAGREHGYVRYEYRQ